MAHLPYPSGPRPTRQKRRSARSRLTLGGGVVAAAVTIGVMAGSGGADTAEADSTTRSADDVTIKDSGLAVENTSGKRTYLVSYKITNTGDRAADYVAQLRFLDKNGDLLGSTDVDAARLPSGDSTADTVTADLDHGSVGDITAVEVGTVDRAETD
ncbi:MULTISPECIES: hypothetical protein [unclassified Streptomyces]|uniref:hypothetical protein n=1 Tax=unclassified Streptomyces TaxID=2593676 RepID=UPI00278BF6EE|nr:MULTISPECIES: hypothetical protein [unclassified Streptomyces]